MEYAGTTFQRTLKKIKWEDVKISGYTSEQLKNEFLRSIKPVKKVRTLMEVILDLEENDAKYKRDTHQDYPKKPFSAFMYYQTENRDKLIKGWQKKQADSTKLPTLVNKSYYGLLKDIQLIFQFNFREPLPHMPVKSSVNFPKRRLHYTLIVTR